MKDIVYSPDQIADAQRRITATPGLVGNAIGEAKAAAHWCLRHHPAVERAHIYGTQLPWDAEYSHFDQRLSSAQPAERLLIAQEMHQRFSALRHEGEAERERQHKAHFDDNVARDLAERKAIAKAHWSDAHPLRKAFVLLRHRLDEIERQIGSVGPEGDIAPLLEDLETALQSIGATAALERKALRKKAA